MRMKRFSGFIAVAMMFGCLVGCSSNKEVKTFLEETTSTVINSSEQETTLAVTEVSNATEEKVDESKEDKTDVVEEKEELSNKISTVELRKKYADYLIEIRNAGYYLSLSQEEVMLADNIDSSSLDQNFFAIADIDQDGKEEIIYKNSNSTSAGMYTAVFRYNEENDKVEPYFMGCVTQEYYEGGFIVEKISHNHSYSMEVWPYFVNHLENNEYTRIYEVQGIEKAILESMSGEEFPSDVDLNGDGLVYEITMTNTSDKKYMDEDEYLDFTKDINNEISVEFIPFTIDNIESMAK